MSRHIPVPAPPAIGALPRDSVSGVVLGARTVRMAYWARVVMPGSFLWEPAFVHAAGALNHGTLVPEATVTIR